LKAVAVAEKAPGAVRDLRQDLRSRRRSVGTTPHRSLRRPAGGCPDGVCPHGPAEMSHSRYAELRTIGGPWNDSESSCPDCSGIPVPLAANCPRFYAKDLLMKCPDTYLTYRVPTGPKVRGNVPARRIAAVACIARVESPPFQRRRMRGSIAGRPSTALPIRMVLRSDVFPDDF